MASSQGVVIASNQSPVSVTGTVNIGNNPSVSGTVGASVIGHAPVVIVGGSIAASLTPPANQSVSGTVGSSIIGVAPVRGDVANGTADTSNQPVGVGGRYLASPGTYTDGDRATALMDVNGRQQVNISSSIGHIPVAIVGGSIAASFTPPANQSVSGTVQTDVRGSVATVIIGGSIAASFVPPANQSVSGTVGSSVIGHAPVVIVGGSIAASFTPPANQSVSGTVGASIIGLPPVNVTNFPAVQVVAPNNSSLFSLQPAGSILAVSGSFTPAANQSVSGTVGASVIGHAPVFIVGGSILTSSTPNQSVSGTVGASIVGTVPVTQSGTWQPSALGYLTRNDNVSSFLGANLTTRPMSGDSAGRVIVKPFGAEEARVEGYASVVSTSVTTLVASAGVGLRNYITDFFIANTGGNTTLVTFRDGLGSILGYTIAPSNGGSNAPGLATPIRTSENASFDFQATTASSILFATVKGFKAP